MAARIQYGEAYTSTTNVPNTPATTLFWGQLPADINNWQNFFSVDVGGTQDYIQIETDTDGVSLMVFTDKGVDMGPILTLTIGTWYRMALLRSGSNTTFHVGPAGGALITTSRTNWPDYTATVMRIGGSPFAGEGFDGNIANFKYFNEILTIPEIEAELAQYVPLRTTNLVRWHPLLIAGTEDYSGFGRNLSGGTGVVTSAEGPPIPWVSEAPLVTAVPKAVAPYLRPDDIPENLPVTPGSVAQPLVAVPLRTFDPRSGA